jgi:hypothetical protein
LSHKKFRIGTPDSMGRSKKETGGPLGIEDVLIARRSAIAANVGSRKPLFSDAEDGLLCRSARVLEKHLCYKLVIRSH